MHAWHQLCMQSSAAGACCRGRRLWSSMGTPTAALDAAHSRQPHRLPPPVQCCLAEQFARTPAGRMQGLHKTNGGLFVLDVASGSATPLVNNWAGVPFNSPNDVAVHGPSGAILFTDPPYGFAQGFRPAPQVGWARLGGVEQWLFAQQRCSAGPGRTCENLSRQLRDAHAWLVSGSLMPRRACSGAGGRLGVAL